MKIGAVIKDLRTKQGFSQQDLAKNLGITQSYLSHIERDKREPSISLIKQISIIFNIPQTVIFLLSSDSKKKGNYDKQLKKIATAIDEILKAC